METMKSVEKILLTEVAGDLGKKSLAPDEDLLAQGIIDSLGVVKLVVSLEEAFGIELPDEDIVPENFENLNALVQMVEQKMRDK